jgi:hypothetical protein
MTVLNVLSTNSINGGQTEYQVVQSGVYRIICTAANQTVSINDGPAIQLIQNQPLIVKGGKSGQARVVKATDSATTVYTLGTHLGEVSNTHPFSVGDYIAVEDDSTSPAIDSAFLSAGTVGKKITAITGSTITTNIDSTDADPAGDYTYAYSGNQALVRRCVKIVVGATNAITVEEVQVVGG